MNTQTMSLAFEKIANFRDIGGHDTKDGKRMRAGIFYRSDELSGIGKNDLAALEMIGLKMICDLRTVNEQKSKPDKIPPHWDIKMIHIPIYHASQDFSKVEFFKFLYSNADKIDLAETIRDFYKCLVTERSAEIRQVIDLVAKDDHLPVLIHCTAGKDRTGFIAALLQLVAGVPYETVVNEYLHSNDRIGPRMKKIERFIRMMSLYRIEPERIKPLLAVDRRNLDYAISHIEDEYGTVEDYLIKGCGIEEGTMIRLKKLLVE